METVVEYRERADALVREAEESLLPNVKGLKLEAARRFRSIAEELEIMICSRPTSTIDWVY
ncbi:MAG TPA: hypothetical protein VLA37_04915 [Sphingomonadaceae bacterium]|nr:hypothetical protein [Sphingomonadaceae bacterium]